MGKQGAGGRERGTSVPLLPIVVIIGSVLAIGGLILLERDEAGEDPAASATPADPGSTFLAGGVPAGPHTVSAFNPPLKLTVTEGWTSLGIPDDDQVILEGPALFVIARVTQVWDNDKVDNIPVPDDLIEWFRTDKDFRADEPISVTIGGYPARQMDMTSVETVDTIFFPTMEHLRIGKDDRTRITVIDVDGAQIAAITTVEPDKFDAAIAQSQPIVDSLQFNASEDAG